MQVELSTLIYGIVFAWWLFIASFIFAGIRRTEKAPHRRKHDSTFSVIIATTALNSNLKNLILRLGEQNFDSEKFELILIFNNCQLKNNSLEFFKSVTFQYKILFAAEQPNWSSKKNALWQGAQAAKNTFLIFTDADCTVAKCWLSKIAEFCSHNLDVLLGYAPIISRQQNLAGILAEVDSSINNLSAAAGAGWQKPFMANGRNLVIRRELYLNSRSLTKISGWVSGDDDLLVQRINAQNKLKTEYCYDKAAHVESDAPQNLPQYLLRRGRHVSAAFGYSPMVKFSFAFYEISRVILLAACPLVLTATHATKFLIIPALCFSIEYLLLKYFHKKCASKLAFWRYCIWLTFSSFTSIMALILYLFATEKWPTTRTLIENRNGA